MMMMMMMMKPQREKEKQKKQEVSGTILFENIRYSRERVVRLSFLIRSKVLFVIFASPISYSKKTSPVIEQT